MTGVAIRTMSTESTDRKPDPLYVVILLGVCIVSVWLLLMPFYPAIAKSTLRRFHLETDSFALWAAQAPIPAMYNCANEYEIRDLPEGLITPVIDTTRARYINHYPTRVLTFANGRYTLLSPGQDRWVTMRSTYRGITLESKVHAAPMASGGFFWHRQSSEFVDPSNRVQSETLLSEVQ